MNEKGRGKKGTFGDLELPVAGAYPPQLSRRRMLLAGLLVVVLVTFALLFSELFRGGRWASKGPLSSAHAAFGADCSNCHGEAERAVTDENCSSCHEKFGDQLGVYTFSAHYLYRSDDFRRLVPSERERQCFACHIEHEGRDAVITRVSDEQCSSCHFASFADEHPQFEFAAESIADPSGLEFPHVHHVREVMKRQKLEDVEQACLYCHNAKPEGRSFEPVSFDRHCDACHLTTTTATPGLPILGASSEEGDDGSLGVETLEQIGERGGPGTRWVYFSNPNEFRLRGSVIVKSTVHHRDPWILDNLRRLRGILYPDAGLAELLLTSADTDPHEIRVLYDEAIATLEEQAIGLRGRPELDVQVELERIDDLLQRLKREVADPFAPLDETKFVLALERREDNVTDELQARVETLIGELAEPCLECHELSAATIKRVQKDQRVLRRAEFDHRAHIIQARCLDCHRAIPIVERLADTTPIEKRIDQSAIQNLPPIETCRRCHRKQQASEQCVTCHFFHANKSRRSEMLLYLSEEPQS